jgi:hypothetical protein
LGGSGSGGGVGGIGGSPAHLHHLMPEEEGLERGSSGYCALPLCDGSSQLPGQGMHGLPNGSVASSLGSAGSNEGRDLSGILLPSSGGDSFTFATAGAAAAAAVAAVDAPPVPRQLRRSVTGMGGGAGQQGCLVLKFVSSRLLCQSEQFASELTRHVGLCVPDSRILRSKVGSLAGQLPCSPMLTRPTSLDSKRAFASPLPTPLPMSNILFISCISYIFISYLPSAPHWVVPPAE